MRINHNIAALNTYNKLSANTAATAKSLEKLSSGLKINKAGDNAAGLAISEKMRGQIRGLDQASTNASDAISLINTAEGALSETHSILQRMRELAVQSSNDTNVTIDREEIQKEMNQLTSEINRIGNTTEFNTQKLLNGGGAQTVEQDVDLNVAGGKAGKVSTITTAVESKTGKSSLSIELSGNTFTLEAKSSGDNFSGMTVNIISGAATGVSGVPGTSITITVAETETIANIQAALDGSALFGGGATFTMTNSTTGAEGAALGAGTAAALSGATATPAVFSAATGQDQKGVYSFKITEAFVSDGATISLNLANAVTPDSFSGITLTADENGVNSGTGAAGTFNIGADAATRLSAEDQAKNIVTALKASTWDLNGVAAGGAITDYYDVRADGDTIIFTEKAALGAGAKISDPTLGGTNTAIQGQSDYIHQEVVGVGGSIIIDDVEIAVVDGNGAQDALNIQNGTAIKWETGDTTSTQMSKIKDAVASNSTLNTKYSGTVATNTLTLTQLSGVEGSGEPVIKISDIAGQTFNANFQIGANTAQSLTVEIEDMRSSALHITGNKAGETRTAKNNSVATFTTTKNVTDGTTNDGVEYALDVTTHEKATAAISVINDAIETVSAERSKLGSYQNRLEHTINNLGTSSENLTTAESRIRDVDMAKEMMEFTKNNILSQAAQSMLAQANQQPQGVLQLLQ